MSLSLRVSAVSTEELVDPGATQSGASGDLAFGDPGVERLWDELGDDLDGGPLGCLCGAAAIALLHKLGQQGIAVAAHGARV